MGKEELEYATKYRILHADLHSRNILIEINDKGEPFKANLIDWGSWESAPEPHGTDGEYTEQQKQKIMSMADDVWKRYQHLSDQTPRRPHQPGQQQAHPCQDSGRPRSRAFRRTPGTAAFFSNSAVQGPFSVSKTTVPMKTTMQRQLDLHASSTEIARTS